MLKVSSKTNATKVAGAIANALKNENKVEILAVGAGSLNQALKGIAIARGYVAPTGKDLICIPAFSEVKIDGEDRTAINLIVRVL